MKKYLFMGLVALFVMGCGGAKFEDGQKAENSGNLEKAIKIYTKACKNDDLQSCFAMLWKTKGEGSKVFKKQIEKIYANMCLKDSNISACDSGAIGRDDEKLRAKISNKYNDLILKACDKKEKECFLRFAEHGVKADDLGKAWQKKIKVLEKNCNANAPEFCIEASRLYARGFKDDKGFDIIEANEAKSEELINKAKEVAKKLCESGKNEGCKFVLNNLRYDENLDELFFDKACNKGSSVACKASAKKAKGDAKIAYFNKACDLKDADACETLMESYRDGTRGGWFSAFEVEKDQKKAKEYLNKLCKIDKKNRYCK